MPCALLCVACIIDTNINKIRMSPPTLNEFTVIPIKPRINLPTNNAVSGMIPTETATVLTVFTRRALSASAAADGSVQVTSTAMIKGFQPTCLLFLVIHA